MLMERPVWAAISIPRLACPDHHNGCFVGIISRSEHILLVALVQVNYFRSIQLSAFIKMITGPGECQASRPAICACSELRLYWKFMFSNFIRI